MAVLVIFILLPISTAAPAAVVRTSLQKTPGGSDGFEMDSDDQSFYTYIYEYEENGDQIWSDCSKMIA